MQFFNNVRNMMVEEQLISRGIDDKRVLSAFRKIPRHLFVKKEDILKAYKDYPIAIGFGQTISQPYIVALMIQSLELKGVERVLEIGTGSGYESAILAELAKEVYTVERIGELSTKAQEALSKLKYKNIRFKVGDGILGWEEEAPFDRVIVSAGAPYIPERLSKQMGENSIMIIPLGGEDHQELTLVRKSGRAVDTTALCGCIFVKLISENG